MLKHDYQSTYRPMNSKHLNRYICALAGHHNQRPSGAIDQMEAIVQGMGGKRLQYKDLIL